MKTGGGGKRAVVKIVDCINKALKKVTWTYCLSGTVGNKELYAVIWDTEIMGEILEDGTDYKGRRLMDNFFGKPTTGPATRQQHSTAEDRAAAPYFKIGDATNGASIDLSTVHKKWLHLDACGDGDVNLSFDRMPVLFSFRPPFLDFDFHIIACHSSTGEDGRSPHQNMIETAYLQSMCTQAAKKGEYVVLLGDFNTAETYNHTEYMWDDKVPFQSVEESALFEPTSGEFLKYYYRGVPDYLPTNVFPFLSGGCATPKHNDDIWLQKTSKFNKVTNVGTRDGRGNSHKGVVLPIPQKVLSMWDKKTRDYFEEHRNGNFDKGWKQRLNRMLSMSWSDHRPIAVELSTPSTGKSERKKSIGSNKKNMGQGENLNEVRKRLPTGFDDTRQSEGSEQEQDSEQNIGQGENMNDMFEKMSVGGDDSSQEQQDSSKDHGSSQEQDVSNEQMPSSDNRPVAAELSTNSSTQSTDMSDGKINGI